MCEYTHNFIHCITYKRSQFGCEKHIMKSTLLRERNTLRAVSRVPFDGFLRTFGCDRSVFKGHFTWRRQYFLCSGSRVIDMEDLESTSNRRGNTAEKILCSQVKHPLFWADSDQTYTTPIKSVYFFNYL